MTIRFRIWGGGHQTNLSSGILAGQDCNYKWSELINAGFNTEYDCWVSVHYKWGKKNHEWGDI